MSKRDNTSYLRSGMDREETSFGQGKLRLLRPNVFAYNRLSELLEDWVKYLATKKQINKSILAKKACLSTSYFTMVFSGKRSISEGAFKKILPFLDMKKEEAEFTALLRDLDGARTQKMKDEAYQKIQNSRAYLSENIKETDTYQYYSNWVFVLVRELVNHPKFVPDPKWIQKKLKFKTTQKEIAEALDFLIKTNLIRLNQEGKYEATQEYLTCDPKIFYLALTNYHKNILGLAQESLNISPSNEDRYIAGKTLMVSRNAYEQICDYVNKVKDEISQISKKDTDEKNLVLQVELAAFIAADASDEEGDK